MSTQDNCVTIVPYFKIHEGKADSVKAICEQFIHKAKTESGCLYYGFSFNGDQFHCREGYKNAEGLLAHLQNVGTLLQETLTMADITRLEVHGPEDQLAKLHGPLADLNPEYWSLEYGFRN